MPNLNYNRGRAKEYRIVQGLKKKGWDIVQRSAGSKSPIDVFAINIKEKKILLIQAKSGYLSDSQSTKIYQENKDLKGKFEVEFELCCGNVNQ